MKKYYTILALLLTNMYCQAQSPEENLKKLGITLQVPNGISEAKKAKNILSMLHRCKNET